MVISFNRPRSIAYAKAWRSLGLSKGGSLTRHCSKYAAHLDRLQNDAGAILNRKNICRRELVNIVDFPGQQALHADDRPRQVLDHDAIEIRQPGLPIVGVALQHHAVAACPLLQHERARTDRGVAETRTALLQSGRRHHKPGTLAVEAAWEERGRLRFTQCCNLPIQGICADAMLRAIRMAYARLRAEGVRGGLVACVHDELLLEVQENDTSVAGEILTRAMIDAFIETFPGAPTTNLVDVKIGKTWADVK